MLKGACPLCGVGHGAGCQKGVLNEEGKLVLKPQAPRAKCTFCSEEINPAHAHRCDASTAAMAAQDKR